MNDEVTLQELWIRQDRIMRNQLMIMGALRMILADTLDFQNPRTALLIPTLADGMEKSLKATEAYLKGDYTL